MQSYDYGHRAGVQSLTYDDIAAMVATLAERLTAAGPVDLVLGVARAGLIPATMLAAALCRDLAPVRLSRREQDEVRHATPVWRVPVPADVAGRHVVVVDEIADTGETLRLVVEQTRERGAVSVRAACLIAHSWAAPMPDAVAAVSDAMVIFPWDRRVLIDGRWQPHPELLAGLQAQGLSAAEAGQILS